MKKAIAALALATLAGQASANIVFYDGLVGGSGDVENVLLRDGDSGFNVYGDTNQSQTEIQFNSVGTELLNVASGQARIEALDAGLITDINFGATGNVAGEAVGDIGFLKVQFNVDVSEDSTAYLRAVDNFGTDFFFELSAEGNGQNFVTVVAEDDQWIARMFIDGVSVQGIEDLQQVRVGPGVIGDPGQQAIPIPAAAWLFGSGLLGLVGVGRKRRSLES